MAMKIVRSKEDNDWIKKLQREISANRQNMTVEKLKATLEKPIVVNPTQYAELPQASPHYMFWTMEEAEKALLEFFSDYTAKRLAIDVYDNDSGDIIKESLEFEEPLGLVLKKKRLVPAYEMEVAIQILPFYEDNQRMLGMPFVVKGIKLVAE